MSEVLAGIVARGSGGNGQTTSLLDSERSMPNGSQQGNPRCTVCDDTRTIETRFTVIAEGRHDRAVSHDAIVLARAGVERAEEIKDPLLISKRRALLEELERAAGKFAHYKTVAVPCTCVDRINTEDRVRAAGVPSDLTFDTWTERDGTERAYEGVKAYLNGGAEGILVLTGTYGSGKTHLLAASIHGLAESGISSRYRYVPKLRQELIASLDRNSPGPSTDALILMYAENGVLGLDDLGAGAEKPRPFIVEAIETIVNLRYEKGPGLIVTTNLTPEEMEANWGGRIADRLFDIRSGRARQVFITAPSYRR